MAIQHKQERSRLKDEIEDYRSNNLDSQQNADKDQTLFNQQTFEQSIKRRKRQRSQQEALSLVTPENKKSTRSKSLLEQVFIHDMRMNAQKVSSHATS